MLSEAYRHCGEIAREHRRDAWLGALFAPEAARPHLHALQAFAFEIGRIKAAVREPLMGEIRLTWWREALEGARAAEASSHPVAAALIDTLAQCGVKPDELEPLFRARREEIYRDAELSREGQAAWRAEASGPIYALGARCLGAAESPALTAAARAAGAAEAGLDANGDVDVALRAIDEAEAALRSLPASLAPAFAALAPLRLDLLRRARGRDAAPLWRRQLAIWLWMRRR